jgi:hypothetical protein
MSRSYRHSPFKGNGANSDKPGKIQANRTLRFAVRQAINSCRDWDNLVVPLLREVSNVWDFPKDGKGRIEKTWPDYTRYMRK